MLLHLEVHQLAWVHHLTSIHVHHLVVVQHLSWGDPSLVVRVVWRSALNAACGQSFERVVGASLGL